MGFSQACVKLRSKKNITVEWGSYNLITAFHWGKSHGGGGFVRRECFSWAIRENGVNDWE